MRTQFYNFPLFLLSLIFAVVLCYYPGTSGPFLLDDYGSLADLGNTNVIDSFEELLQYVFGGITGPGGRPFSLLTFAANAQTWPAEPYPFIITNILIHALNSVLVFWFLTKLFEASRMPKAQARFMIIAVTALWALHPFHVSTVLYIVQRMTLLAATFSLLVFICYLYARQALLAGRIGKLAGLALGAALAAAFAFYSKESAVLLPVQVLLLEAFLLYSVPNSANLRHKLLIGCCLIPAAIVVVGYPIKLLLEHLFDYYNTGIEPTYRRTYTLFERLLTQQRVLGDYMLNILLPKMQSSGVFHDGYPISTSLTAPISTLFWGVFHLSAIAITFMYRKRWPLVFLGVWWFYASHLMESTVVMLELKFEHRNYMPSIGLCVLIVYILSKITDRARRNVATTAIAGVYAGFLLMSSELWGNRLEAAMVWVEENPQSTRAYDHAATVYIQQVGKDETAKSLVRKSIGLSQSAESELKYILTFCDTFDGSPVDWQRLATQLDAAPRDWSLYSVFKRLLSASIDGRCDLLTLDGFRPLLEAYRLNPVYQGTPSIHLMDNYEILAALHFDEPGLAKLLDGKFDEKVVPLAFQMNRALYFAEYGYLDYAVQKLDRATQVAQQLGNENAFTVKNANEMLELMKAELAETSGAD